MYLSRIYLFFAFNLHENTIIYVCFAKIVILFRVQFFDSREKVPNSLIAIVLEFYRPFHPMSFLGRTKDVS